MRFFASVRVPKTPLRVGLITGPFGGPHPAPVACKTCGRQPAPWWLGWGYIVACMVVGAAFGVWFMWWFGRP